MLGNLCLVFVQYLLKQVFGSKLRQSLPKRFNPALRNSEHISLRLFCLIGQRALYINNARFHTPLAIAVGRDNTLYISDSLNTVIRALSPSSGLVWHVYELKQAATSDG